MRFGIFYEHQLPRPWPEGAGEKLLTDALDQVELADRVGFDYVWEVEHHFLEEYSHSSAPEVFLAAASQRTKRIRLGHGIVQLPPAFNPPARIVERAATLDLISGGRVDLGTGEASSQAELGGFGVTRAAKREQWEEALAGVARMCVEEPFAGAEGKHVTIPPRNVVPKAKQKPHPPLWVACSRRDTILMAARKGLGALSFSFVEPEAAKEWVDEYYALIASDECVPGGFSVNANFAVVLPMMLHPEEAVAIERGIDGAHFFGYSLAHYYVFGDHRPGATDVWEEFLANRDERGFARSIVTPDDAPLGVKLLQEGLGSLRGAIGTPEQVHDLCRRYEAAGVDQGIFVLQAGNNRHEHICESIELFGSEVVPRFAGEAEAREQAKRERLAGAVEAALGRREPPRTLDEEYVIAPMEEPRPAYSSGGGDGSLGDRARAAVESAFSAFVHGRSDEQLDRFMGTGPGLRLVFKGMENAFVPEAARGFEGEIFYELRSSRGPQPWTLTIDGSRASADQRPATSPAVSLRAEVPVFVRIVAGGPDPMRAMLDQRLEVEGDLQLVSRLGDMFGAVPRT